MDEDGTVIGVGSIISVVSTTELSIKEISAGSLPSPIPVGTRYTISPVAFRITLPPAGDGFNRTILHSLGVCASYATGDAVNLKIVSGFRSGDVPVTPLGEAGRTGEKYGQVALTDDPEDCFVYASLADVRVTPVVRLLCAGARFELTNVRIKGKLTTSESVTTA